MKLLILVEYFYIYYVTKNKCLIFFNLKVYVKIITEIQNNSCTPNIFLQYQFARIIKILIKNQYNIMF